MYSRERSDFFRPWTANTWRYYFDNDETRYRQPMTVAMVALMTLLSGSAGLAKLLGAAFVVDRFIAWGYAPWIIPLIGAFEIVGAGLLAQRRTALLGAAMLGTVMLGALATHLASGEYGAALVPLFGGIVLAGIAERAHDDRALRQSITH